MAQANLSGLARMRAVDGFPIYQVHQLLTANPVRFARRIWARRRVIGLARVAVPTIACKSARINVCKFA